MFKDVPKWDAEEIDDPVQMLLASSTRTASTQAIVGVEDDVGKRAVRDFPDRFFAGIGDRPQRGHGGAAQDRPLRERVRPPVPSARSPPACTRRSRSTTRSSIPIYAKCIELDIPFCSTAGVPGPAAAVTRRRTSRYIDEVCWFFPELKFVTRHGCEPWTDLAVKLLLKWPNLYYSTTAFAPKYYPKDIIDFANTRGADKVMFAGLLPRRASPTTASSREMPDVPFRDHVWPKFLRENAQRVFKLP